MLGLFRKCGDALLPGATGREQIDFAIDLLPFLAIAAWAIVNAPAWLGALAS